MSARFRRLDRRRNLPWTGQGRRGKQVDSVISRPLPRCSSARLRFSRSLACRGCGRTFSARTGTARRRPHRDDATWATCQAVERRFSEDLGSGVFGQVSGVVISGDFTGQPRACSGRRRPNQAEIVTPGFGGRARPLSSPRSAAPHDLTGEGRPGSDSAPAGPNVARISAETSSESPDRIFATPRQRQPGFSGVLGHSHRGHPLKCRIHAVSLPHGGGCLRRRTQRIEFARNSAASASVATIPQTSHPRKLPARPASFSEAVTGC